ncbi:MAG: class I SAM-dependent methyltransferase [bacterium]|nr:class I SAM-dependent methyltransferase [bacterium]
MDRAFYLQTSRIEDRHWWFVHRRLLVHDWLADWARGLDGPTRALDIGCGSGGNLPLLGELCDEVVGLDRSTTALELAREKQPSGELVEADANEFGARFAPRSLDLISIFNVLYHQWIESESRVLTQVRDALRPGGRLILTEPAFPILFRRHDVIDHGARRYRRKPLMKLVEGAGLRVLRTSYFNSVAFPPALALAALEKLLGGSERPSPGDVGELRVPPQWLNGSIVAALGIERALLQHVRLPIGVGVALLAQRSTRE